MKNVVEVKNVVKSFKDKIVGLTSNLVTLL